MNRRITKIIKRSMVITLSILVLFTLFILYFLQRTEFGKQPDAVRLERIINSPNYKDGQFQNQENTPAITEGYNYAEIIYEFIFKQNERVTFKGDIPSVKTDLKNLPADQNVLIWFGHSSYFIQLNGKRILVDPNLRGSASPSPFGTKAFKGSNPYTADDIPAIDYLFITHDHWDHLDHQTILQLKPRIKKIITGLGTGAHLEYWGFDNSIIEERDWDEKIELGDDFIAYTAPARHFSGRGFARNKSLWTAFVLQAPDYKIFIGGDSGYGKHFAETGKKHGGFDLAILENGQYDRKWKYIHMMPDEVLQAAKDLNAKRLMPVHSGKFALANHAWDDPFIKISEFNKKVNMPLVTPIIGAPVYLDDPSQIFTEWWVGLEESSK